MVKGLHDFILRCPKRCLIVPAKTVVAASSILASHITFQSILQVSHSQIAPVRFGNPHLSHGKQIYMPADGIRNRIALAQLGLQLSVFTVHAIDELFAFR